MGIVSNALLLVSGTYLALGLMYMRFWLDERSRRDYLAFALSCLAYTLFSWFELGMMHSATPDEYLFYAWWNFFPGNFALVAMAWFAYLRLHGRKWLFLAYAASRVLAVAIHLVMANGINFRQINAVGQNVILNETLSYPIAVPNPWMILPHLSHVLMIVFFLNASVRCWQRGERRLALTVGTGVLLFGTTIMTLAVSVLWGLAPIPIVSSFAVLFIVGAMFYELNYDMHRAAMAETKAAHLGGRLAEIVANVPGIVWESRTEPGTNIRKTTFISHYVQRMLGYSPEEWLNEPPGFGTRIIPEEDRARVLRESDEVIETGKEAVSQFRWFTKDGRIRWAENHLAPIVDEKAGIVGLRGVALDVTERYDAQEAIRERETRLAETLDQLQMAASAGNVGMWIRSVDGEVVWASEKAGEIWGFPSGVRFTQSDLIARLHPDDHERVMACVAAMSTGKEEYMVEFRILVGDGTIKWVRSEGRIETADGDQLVRGALVDITDLKLAQEAIHELGSKLMNAQEKERARLARELHDDLSQSIALLSIHLTILRNEPKDLENVKVQLGHYISEVERLAGDVRRISHELHPAKLTQLGLEAALKGFCRDLSTAHPLQIDFNAVDLPGDLPADISLCLYRVTQESLQNVVKHSGASSALVSIGSEHDRIHLAVSDNGKGFDPEATAVKEALGLISINERVRAVDGTVNITSRIGAGTEIQVQVPVGNHSNGGINNGSKAKSERIRVVVADDSEPVLAAIVGILAPHFEIIGTADNGTAALEMIDRLKPDVAVLDVSMPFKTGIEVTADLKTSSPEVKVVIISANDDESYINAATSAGAVAYVAKINFGNKLVSAVERAITAPSQIADSEKF